MSSLPPSQFTAASRSSLPRRADPVAWLDAVAKTNPSRRLIETRSGKKISYQEVREGSEKLAAALFGLGVKPGERVLVQAEKSPAYVTLYLACLRAGAVFVPLNTAYTAAELDYFVADAAPRLMVVDPERQAEAQAIARKHKVAHVHSLGADGAGSLLQVPVAPPRSKRPVLEDDPARLAALIYTSGTTGRSKGAMLTLGNLASNGLALAEAWRFKPTDVLLHALPVFHVHGLFIAINTVLAVGASMLFLRKFDVEEVMHVLPQASVMMGVPTFYTRLLQHRLLSERSTEHMRVFISGSAPLLEDTFRGFQTRTGYEILERYGMSETLINTSMPYDGPRVPGSVGKALPGVDVRVVDASTRALVEPGKVGMIEVRGPNVFAGYWRNEEKTRADLHPDGFFSTGDLGSFDRRGYLSIVGRAKDLVITGGYNVYPVEIENEIDGLDGVVESAVIGLPHADFGEAVTAVVVLEAPEAQSEAAILAALEGRLAKFKVPKRVLVVSELPRNAMGKVQKALLRQSLAGTYRR